jgi:FkbM family methyltransferase
MALKHRLFEVVEKPFAALFRSANQINTRLLQSAAPTKRLNSRYGPIELACPNTVTYWRARSFFTKEPDTLEWIDGFAEGDVLFDIGANVGLYSLYAGKKGHTVFAFEPEAANFALLNQNIYLNQLQHQVSAYNFAISNYSGLERLHISKMEGGSALHSISTPTGFGGENFKPVHLQGVQAYSLDELIERSHFCVPNHLKIDVDGLEPEIIAGATALLENPRLKSLLVELNVEVDHDLELKRNIESFGFTCIRQYQAEMFGGGEYGGIYNFTFVRNALP